MKTDKKPVIGLFCVILSCVLVIGITLGLLSSANNNEVAAGSTVNTTDATVDSPASESGGAPELEWGYKLSYDSDVIVCGGWLGTMAYRSPVSIFNIDDVTLTISFGSLCSDGPDESNDIPVFEIYFADPLDGYTHIYDLKRIEENFLSKKYDIKYVRGETENSEAYYEFNHSEEITIPKELFTESEGIICMVMYGENVAEHAIYGGILGKATIKYKLNGDNEVVLACY